MSKFCDYIFLNVNHILVSLVLYDSKLKVFGLWSKHDLGMSCWALDIKCCFHLRPWAKVKIKAKFYLFPFLQLDFKEKHFGFLV